MKIFNWQDSSHLKNSQIFHNGIADPDHAQERDESLIEVRKRSGNKVGIQKEVDEIMKDFK